MEKTVLLIEGVAYELNYIQRDYCGFTKGYRIHFDLSKNDSH